jgi:hypothetical protein
MGMEVCSSLSVLEYERGHHPVERTTSKLAQELKTLAEFNLDILTADAIHVMMVRDSENRVVYCYSRLRPQDSCNAYYDHMPMEGYWPWPRKDEIL